MIYWQIFLAFFRSGIFGYGGGPSSIPLVYKEVVDNFKWMTDEDFSDVLAIGNALPGPIATKMAGYIGYRVRGLVGMMVAIIANVIPTVGLVILLLTVFNAYKDRPWVHGMSQAVVPVVGVMLGMLTWDFVKKSKTYFGWFVSIILIAITVILLQWVGIHPAVIIIVLLSAALFFEPKKQSKKANSS
ncbi:chromate transporter [Bacillus kwashiorkori]|uniref:chromate transporter n=1 Tax=Bacillus kwashiorkori TaxID=1522318 RepID=UPI000781FD5F|nr:chromate transporter [Bacillus kwashiorkori]